MRAFIAIDSTPEIIEEAIALQRRISPFGAFSFPKSFHITLKFLGEIDEAKAVRIRALLAAIRFRRFSYETSGIGFFPDEKYIRVAWLGTGACPQLVSLQEGIDIALAAEGFSREKDFVPHITVARVKAVRDKKGLLGLKSAAPAGNVCDVSSFVLYRSTLLPAGPVYDEMARFRAEDL